jgi:hypothetical protein
MSHVAARQEVRDLVGALALAPRPSGAAKEVLSPAS